MFRVPVVALAVAVLVALAAPGSAAAADPLLSLKASCTGVMHPVGASGQSLDGLGYRFCDDGTPAFGGRTANPGGSQAVLVPAAYRYPDPAPAGVADPTVDGLPPLDPGAAGVGGADPSGHIALDVDLTLPAGPPPPGGYPVMVMMHGCCSGSRTSWETGSTTSPGNIDAKGEKWHYSNVWFASRGYVVLTYTARGFVDGSNHGSTGETQIDSLQYEINDYQYLVGLLADDPTLNVDPQRVVVTGGSYGGGFSWLAFTDPLWTSPGGKAMRLAAAAPKYGWTDLVYSLLPTGRHFYDLGPAPATDGSDSGLNSPPVGIPIRSIIAGLFLAGTTGVPPGTNHATFPQSVQDSFNCTQTVYPAESNPLCGASQASLLPDFIRYRSAYYRNGFFARLASDPAYRTPVFDAGTHTDPLFPPVENHRMANRLRSTVPGYPIKEYYGDYQHFEQNKEKEWGDVCTGGGARHVCTSADYPGGDFNADPSGLARTGVTTLLNRFVDHYAAPPGDPSAPAPTFDATASLQICPQNAGPDQPADEPGPTFTAPTYGALATGRLTLDLLGDQRTTSTASPNPHGAHSDPIVNQQTNHGGACPVEQAPAGPGVATYDSPPLTATATMIGGSVVTATFAASGTDGVELNARLYDVFPDGTAVMVDRGPRRVSPAEAQHGTLRYQLHGNGWRFPAGHRVRVELAQDDEPYLKHSDVPSSLAIGRVSLSIPVREDTYGPGGGAAFTPTARMLAPRVSSSDSPGPRFRIRWRGSSIGSPIAGFRVEVRALNTPRARVTGRAGLLGAPARASATRWRAIGALASTLRTSTRFRGREGVTYQFRVRARTAAGRVSRWSTATTVVPVDERRAGIRYRGPWRRPRSRGAFRGRLATCASRGCRVAFAYRGSTLYLVGRTGPTGGRARVRVDRVGRTVDFYSRRPGVRRVVLRLSRRVATHRVRIAVLGRHRRAARGSRVAIDAFGLARLRWLRAL